MKPFSLEEYLNNPNKRVVTRDGRDVRIICVNFNGPYPIVIEVKGIEVPVVVTKEGKQANFKDGDLDLFFKSKKHKGYACVYFTNRIYYLNDTIYSSKEEADNHAKHFSDSIATIPIEWED